MCREFSGQNFVHGRLQSEQVSFGQTSVWLSLHIATGSKLLCECSRVCSGLLCIRRGDRRDCRRGTFRIPYEPIVHSDTTSRSVAVPQRIEMILDFYVLSEETSDFELKWRRKSALACFAYVGTTASSVEHRKKMSPPGLPLRNLSITNQCGEESTPWYNFSLCRCAAKNWKGTRPWCFDFENFCSGVLHVSYFACVVAAERQAAEEEAARIAAEEAQVDVAEGQ